MKRHKKLALKTDTVRLLVGREIRAVVGGFPPLPWPDPYLTEMMCYSDASYCPTACIDQCPM